MNEDFLAAVQAERGAPVKELEEKPDVTPYIVEWIDTYFFLDSSRQITMNGPGAIPLSEVLAYATHFPTLADSLKEFCYIIQRMDSTYLKYVQEQQDKKSNKPKGTQRK